MRISLPPSNRAGETSPATIRVRRDHILRYASELTTDKTNPAAVIANARPLIDWALVANAADQDARCKALSRAHHNRDWGRKPDDAPALLIAEAEAYYAILKAA